jgi:hypothetical protein
LWAHREDEMPEEAVSTIGVDGGGVGVELSLKDEKG